MKITANSCVNSHKQGVIGISQARPSLLEKVKTVALNLLKTIGNALHSAYL